MITEIYTFRGIGKIVVYTKDDESVAIFDNKEVQLKGSRNERQLSLFQYLDSYLMVKEEDIKTGREQVSKVLESLIKNNTQPTTLGGKK